MHVGWSDSIKSNTIMWRETSIVTVLLGLVSEVGIHCVTCLSFSKVVYCENTLGIPKFSFY